MQGFAYYQPKSSKGIKKNRQSGMSLIPAIITICIFTILSYKVIVPNNIREANKSHIKAVANSAEQLIQATNSYYAVNKSWPTSINGDLVPTYLPIFNSKTLWNETWGIIKYDRLGWTTRSGTPHHISFAVLTPTPETAREIILKIGPHAQLTDKFVDPIDGRYWTVSGPKRVVEAYPTKPGTTTLTDLNITQDITIGRDIILSGKIMASDGKTVLLNATNPPTTSTLETDHYHLSKRFKQNIYPLDTPIESIYQLKPVSFDYKEPFTEYKTANTANQEIGLIAEQVLPLIPEIALVKDDKLTGIDDRKLSILLLKAVQDLKIDVEILQQNNQQLQKQINGLNRDSQKVATLVDLDEMSSAQ